MPTTTPTTTPSTAPVAPPPPAPPASLAVAEFEVECVAVDSMEKAVTLLEEAPDPEKPGKTRMAPHSCVRRCYDYKFELDSKPLTHPAVTIVVSSLESLPFQIRQKYTVSFQ